MEINKEIIEIIERVDPNGQMIVLKPGFQTIANSKEINGGIVYDGIVNYQRFLGVVFLLKEATLRGTKKFGEGWSLVDRPAEEAKKQDGKVPEHWKTVCYWMEAWKNPSTSFMQAKKCGGNLNEVAFMNIKKTAGEGTSANAPLDIIVCDEEYSRLLRDEIDVIKKCGKPLIIICGGTFDYAKKIYRVNPNEVISMNCGTKYFIRNEIVFLSFVHPSIRCGVEVSYAYAQSVFQEFKKTIGY